MKKKKKATSVSYSVLSPIYKSQAKSAAFFPTKTLKAQDASIGETFMSKNASLFKKSRNSS